MPYRLEIVHRDVPSDQEIVQMWRDIRFTEIEEKSTSALKLKDTFSNTHCNGGIQLHKYQISDNPCLQWFASRNRLDQIFFIEKMFERPELKAYRKALEIKNDQTKYKGIQWYSDIFDLAGILSRMLYHGGAYRNVEVKDAWDLASNFVKDEFQNRFDEINRYVYALKGSEWFYNVAWDFSTCLFDKRENTVLIMDITDTD